MEKLKDLHKALEKLQKDASKKHYPKSELDKKKADPEHILQRHYYITTEAERAFMKEFVEAIESEKWIADEGLYSNLVDAIAVEIPGILKQALPVIHTSPARQFVADAKAHIVPFIKEHKTFLESYDLNAKVAIQAAKKLPIGTTLYERVLSASHGENRLVTMQNRAQGKEIERLRKLIGEGEIDYNTLITEFNTLVDNNDSAELEKKGLQDKLDGAVVEMHDLTESMAESDHLRTQAEEDAADKQIRITQYEAETTQLTSEKEHLARDAEATKGQAVFWQKNAEASGKVAAESDYLKSQAEIAAARSQTELSDANAQLKTKEADVSAKDTQLSNAYEDLTQARNLLGDKELELAKALEKLKQAKSNQTDSRPVSRPVVTLEDFFGKENVPGNNSEQSDSTNQSELIETYTQIQTLQSEIISLQERIVYSERDQDEEVRTLQERTTFAEQDLEHAEASIKQFKSDNAEYKARINRFSKVTAENADAVREKDKLIQELQEQVTAGNQDESDSIIEELFKLNTEDIGSSKTYSQAEFDEKTHLHANAKDSVDRLAKILGEERRKNSTLEKDADRLKHENDSYQNTITDLEVELMTTQTEAEEAMQEQEQMYLAKIKKLNKANEELSEEADMWANLGDQARTEADSTSTDAKANTDDLKLAVPPELSGKAGKDYKLNIPPELQGGIEASVESADVTALRAENKNLRAEVEKDADRRYELFYIAEHDANSSVEGRVELYTEYLRVEPEDMHIAGIIYNNFAELLGNKKKDYATAETHLAKAIECAEQDYNTIETDEAKKRLEDYQANLILCKQNKAFFDVGAVTIDTKVDNAA